MSEQLERFDSLSEEMELMVQRNRILQDKSENDFSSRFETTRSEYELEIKRFRADVKRLKEERAADEKAFKEILGALSSIYPD